MNDTVIATRCECRKMPKDCSASCVLPYYFKLSCEGGRIEIVLLKMKKMKMFKINMILFDRW